MTGQGIRRTTNLTQIPVTPSHTHGLCRYRVLSPVLSIHGGFPPSDAVQSGNICTCPCQNGATISSAQPPTQAHIKEWDDGPTAQAMYFKGFGKCSPSIEDRSHTSRPSASPLHWFGGAVMWAEACVERPGDLEGQLEELRRHQMAWGRRCAAAAVLLVIAVLLPVVIGVSLHKLNVQAPSRS